MREMLGARQRGRRRRDHAASRRSPARSARAERRSRLRPEAGEAEAIVDGRTFRPGGKVVLRLGDRTDPYDQMLAGRTASLERIYLDYDDTVYLGVTIDTDPMQEVMRETGRYHFFFADEVELIGDVPARQEGAA